MSREELLARAKTIAQREGGWLPSADVRELCDDFGIASDELLLELIPLARSFSIAPQSGFEVGAVAEGASGAIYLGANLEFSNCPLNQTVHAEQAVVVNAAMRGETGLERLATSAPPCGHCRQFLNELEAADELQVLVNDETPIRLQELLPHAFGPADFDIEERLLSSPRHKLGWDETSATIDAAAEAAIRAAEISYSPYSKSFAGAAITTSNGEIFAGPYLECAAFNPSLSPLNAALVMAQLSGLALSDIAEVVIVQRTDSSVDHTSGAEHLIKLISPSATLRLLTITAG